MKKFAVFVIFGCIIMGAAATCCKRKGDFGCCGNGPCNIFCCNCDNDCNEQCENTHCDTGEWFECAGVVSACAAACVVTEGEACEECMGPMYDTCKKCYSSNSAFLSFAAGVGNASNPTTKNCRSQDTHASRDQWFKEIAGNTRCITYNAFDTYVRKMALAEKTGRVRGNKASALHDADAIGHEFKKHDVNGDGCIDRVEFGI